MAIVTRYFSTSSAGADDGTSWANRTTLYTGGSWSSIIKAFDFSGADSLVCRIGPGTHTIADALTSADFSVAAPTNLNHLTFHGCDSSGNLLTPPDPDWTSDMPDWDDSGLPLITTTTNISTTNLAYINFRLIKLTASGRNGTIVETPGTFEAMNWCSIVNSTNNAAAQGLLISGNHNGIVNTQILMSGANYSAGISATNVSQFSLFNTRVRGVAGTTGKGIIAGSTAVVILHADRLCVVRHAGAGIDLSASTNTASNLILERSAITNNGGSGIVLATPATAALRRSHISRCMMTGNAAYGFDGVTANNAFMLADNRFRDNTSGSSTNVGNNSEFNSYTTDSDDATEYVDATTTFDYRIKSGATIHGSGYGVSDQAAAGGGGGGPFHGPFG